MKPERAQRLKELVKGVKDVAGPTPTWKLQLGIQNAWLWWPQLYYSNYNVTKTKEIHQLGAMWLCFDLVLVDLPEVDHA
jgi:hypothetical protein